MITPFTSNNTNSYTESVFNYAPAVINGQHVLVSQEQQRNLLDQLNTQILDLNSAQNFVHLNKQPIPGGMLFPGHQPQNVWSDLQNNSLQALKYLELSRNRPFQLKFHQDVSTSSTDLAQISGAMPDFTNICGVIPSTSPYHDRRKLVLNSIPEPIKTHVIETMDEKPLKKVTFSENSQTNQEIQCVLCNCENLRRFECKTGRRRGSRGRESSKSASSSEEDLNKSKGHKKRKRRQQLRDEE